MKATALPAAQKALMLTLAAALAACVLLVAPKTQAQGLQKRVDLEDVNIQGEANRNQNLFMNRNRFELDDRIKVRRDFRRELEDSIPPAFDRLPAEKSAAKPPAPSVR